MKPMNLFHIDKLPNCGGEEIFESLLESKTLKIKRIISTGQVTPHLAWYNQPVNEWVVLLQGTAEIEFEDGKLERFSAGEYLFLPSGTKHRVAFTSHKPPCIWLAVYFQD